MRQRLAYDLPTLSDASKPEKIHRSPEEDERQIKVYGLSVDVD